MNRADDFELQLRALTPTSPSGDEASMLYACGYAAGRKSMLNKAAGHAARLKFAATVLVACALSGWGGYQLAQQDSAEPQLAVAPSETDQPLTIPAGPPTDPPQQSNEMIVVIEDDHQQEPRASYQLFPQLRLSLNQLLIPSASPEVSDEGNGVVLTARSGSAEWTRWMEERPFEGHRQQNKAAIVRKTEDSRSDAGSPLTPMQGRRGNIDWKQWIH